MSFLCPVWGSGLLWVSHHQMFSGGCSLPSCTGKGWTAHCADHLPMQLWTMGWALRPEAGNEWEPLVGLGGRCEPERGLKLHKQRPFAWSGASWVGRGGCGRGRQACLAGHEQALSVKALRQGMPMFPGPERTVLQ